MKKSIKGISIAVAVASLGVVAYSASRAIVSYDASPSTGWTDIAVEDYYKYNSTFNVPNAMYVNGGSMVTARHSFVYPSKVATSSSSVSLNEVGQYTIQYFADVNGSTKTMEKTFKVDYPSVYHSEKSTISYGVHKYARSDDPEVTYAPYKGRNTEAMNVRLAKSDTLTFSKLIDISKLTKNDILLDGFFTPDTRGTNDFTKIDFRFTDASDSSVYFDFVFSIYTYSGTAWAKAAGNGQPLSGWNYYDNSGQGSLHQNDDFGTSSGCSFTGYRGHSFLDKETGTIRSEIIPVAADAKESTFEIHYDPVTQALYHEDVQVIDLDDPNYFSKGWSGFKSNMVRLSVTAEGVSGESANFAISDVYGFTKDELSTMEESSLRDTEGPSIEFATDITSLPNAVAGYSFQLPEAYAYDIYSGNCEITKKAWYDYNSENKTRVSIIDNVIQTKNPGLYVVEYIAKDISGNETIRPLYITCLDKADPISFEVVGIPTTIEVGSTINLPAPANITGGSGAKSYSIQAELGGQKQDIEKSFRFEEIGDWKIVYTVTDFVGAEKSIEYHVNVTASTHPSIYEDVVIDDYFIADLEYVVPTMIAKDYATGISGAAEVNISDANGTVKYSAGEKFTPKASGLKGSISFEFVYNGYTLATKTSSLMKVYEEASMYGTIINQLKEERFFDAYGMSLTTTNTSLDATITADSSGFSFITPQSSSDISFVLKNFVMRQGESLTMTLVDYYDKENYVSATLTKIDNGATLTYNGSTVKAALAMDKSNEFTFSFVDGLFGINSIEIEDQPVTAFRNSDKVYVKIDTTMRSGESFTIKSLNGFVFTSAVKDTTGPKIHLLETYGGSYSIGEDYHICAATSFDVLFPNNKTFTLTVRDPEGKYVTDKNGVLLNEADPKVAHDIVLSSYGNYTVDYKSSDLMNNSSEFSYLVNVSDETRPVIALLGEPQTTAKVGDLVRLVAFDVEDNVTSKENLNVWSYVINPNGSRCNFSGKEDGIIAKYEGVYEFHILAMDEASNIGEAIYRVIVSK